MRRLFLHAGGKAWASTALPNTRPTLGLGQKTGIDLPNEVSGRHAVRRVEDPATSSRSGLPARRSRLGIGQGAVAITPVQLIRAIAAISMGGRMVVPHIDRIRQELPSRIRREPARYGGDDKCPDRSEWVELLSPMRCRACCCRKGQPPVGARSRDRHRGQDGYRRRSYRWPRGPSSKTAKIWRRTAGSWGSRPGAIRTSSSAFCFQGGEHGKLAARMATQVIKAYVDKQRRAPARSWRRSQRAMAKSIWAPCGRRLEATTWKAGDLSLDLPRKPMIAAVAAPGLRSCEPRALTECRGSALKAAGEGLA